MLLEGNHSNFSTMIVIQNSVPFVGVSLITGGFIVLGSFLTLQYTNYGILGLILVQGIVQLSYNNWKWPYVVLKEFKLNFLNFIYIGLNESIVKSKSYFKYFQKKNNHTDLV